MMRLGGVQYLTYMATSAEVDELEKRLLCTHRDDGGQDKRLLVTRDWYPMERVLRRTKVKKTRKIWNRNCLLYTFLIILCSMMVTMYVFNRLILARIAEDEKLLYLLENPFLDHYVRPDNETCLICPRRLQTECELFSKSNRRLMVYFVTSAPDHWLQRGAIRSTWGQTVFPRPVFLIGHSGDSASAMDMIARESDLHQDIIVEDFIDSYRNLTLKTGFILKSFLSLCPQAEFLVKTDDDMFLQPRVLAEILEDSDKNQVTGMVQRGARPYRDQFDRYYLPRWLYNETLLPDFVSGWTYVLPGRRVKDIYEISFYLRLVNLEDVFFTGLVAKELNLTLGNDDRFRSKPFRFNNDCLYKPLAAFHNISYQKLLTIWPKVQTLTSKDCDRFIEKERKMDNNRN